MTPDDDLIPAEGHDGSDLDDVEQEAGDEAEVDDTYVLDTKEAEELGVDLDPLEEPESPLS